MNANVFCDKEARIRNSANSLEDIFDGEIYKQLFAGDDGYKFKNNEAFTFSLNTDGISVCDFSNITI